MTMIFWKQRRDFDNSIFVLPLCFYLSSSLYSNKNGYDLKEHEISKLK